MEGEPERSWGSSVSEYYQSMLYACGNSPRINKNIIFNEEDNDLILRMDETRRVSTFPEFSCLEFGGVLLK